MKNIFVYGMIAMLFASCSSSEFASNGVIQKRKYLKGYHVNLIAKTAKTESIKKDLEFFKKSAENSDKTNQESIIDDVIMIQERECNSDNDIMSADISVSPIENNTIGIFPISRDKTHGKQNIFSRTEACDILTLKNGNEIEVKVIEIGTSEIRYKKCDNPEGPTITVRKSEVFSIKYPNGSKDIISSSNSSFFDNSNQSHPEGDRSFIVTLILWFFLGVLGIHRFYLGHIGMGVLYLLTGGLCGIGWVIDIVLLLTGRLKPMNGEFYDEL